MYVRTCLLFFFVCRSRCCGAAEPRQTPGLLGFRFVGRACGHAVRGPGVGGQVRQRGRLGAGVAPHVGKGETKIRGVKFFVGTSVDWFWLVGFNGCYIDWLIGGLVGWLVDVM